MKFKPAHKNIENPPGQIVNPLPHMPSEEIPRSKTIGGIIDRVMRSEALPIKKKLTFDEWVYEHKDTPDHPVTYFNLYKIGCGDMDQETYFFFSRLWKAAQDNV